MRDKLLAFLVRDEHTQFAVASCCAQVCAAMPHAATLARCYLGQHGAQMLAFRLHEGMPGLLPVTCMQHRVQHALKEEPISHPLRHYDVHLSQLFPLSKRPAADALGAVHAAQRRPFSGQPREQD